MTFHKLLLSVCTLILLATNALAQGEVNIYSSQTEHLIRPILEEFSDKTGIAVNLTTGGKSELVSRLEYEGENSPADLLLTVDIGNIYQAKDKGLLQAVQSDTLNNQIPAYLRDPEGFWYGATIRARAIYYNTDLVQPGEISSYEELADPKWKDKLLIRSSSNVYNQSLVAFMLARHGEAETLKWAKGIVSNMARDPQGGDTDQLKALAAGEGAIAVANTYYFARLVAGDDSVRSDEVKDKVQIVLPNQEGEGAHVNIRGGGVTVHAKNKDNAVKLLEYLVSDKGQEFFSHHNFEYPVKEGLEAEDIVQSWGALKRNPLSLEEVGKLHKQAIEIMDMAGWK